MDRRSILKALLGMGAENGPLGRVDAVTMAAADSPRAMAYDEKSPGDYMMREASYYAMLDKGQVQCLLCPNACVIPSGGKGKCLTRANRNGRLYTVAYGLTRAKGVPIRNPQYPLVYHALDGNLGVVGLVGCGLRCSFCFAWDYAQADPQDLRLPVQSPEAIAQLAVRGKVRCLAFSINEPTNNFEFTRDLAVLAGQEGIPSAMSTSGYCNPEPMEAMTQCVDGFVFGLKAFSEANYKKRTEGSLKPVLDNILLVRDRKRMIEIQYLVLPTISDGDTEIRTMAGWVKDNLGPYTPVYLSRFYPVYKMKHLPPTPLKTLQRAARICREEGLRFVNLYLANIFYSDFVRENPGWDNAAACPYCGKSLVEYRPQGDSLDFINNVERGACRFCRNPVPGFVGMVDKV